MMGAKGKINDGNYGCMRFLDIDLLGKDFFVYLYKNFMVSGADSGLRRRKNY